MAKPKDTAGQRRLARKILSGLRDLILKQGLCPPKDVSLEASPTTHLRVRFPNGIEARIYVDMPDAKLVAVSGRGGWPICGPRRFELADPGCIDQVLDWLRKLKGLV